MKQLAIYTLLLLILAVSGCKQADDLKTLKAFSEAKYELKRVDEVRLNGLDVMDKTGPNDFSPREGDSLLASVSDNTLRASSVLQLQVQLPSPEEIRSLTVTQLEWQLLVDGKETLNGVVEESMVLKQGLNTIPINTPVLMTEVEGHRNYEGLSKLMTLMARKQDLQKSLTLQIKPTVQTPVGEVELPNYITVAKPGNS
ncbi:hypothetical protein [Pontibacter vulgaris]|uniref:hypothetical protein n=1 Tax=Pontibacter vulgaris TaxID=2905679 RepID=UPI001FA80D13|nr:hypothetical protein [Pontibacter vulgaris]